MNKLSFVFVSMHICLVSALRIFLPVISSVMRYLKIRQLSQSSLVIETSIDCPNIVGFMYLTFNSMMGNM